MLAKIRLGTSGWSYDEWNHVFYPRRDTKKLSYYSNFFETVEINTTFYSFPKPTSITSWIKNTPKNFIFASKVPQVITHVKKLAFDKGIEEDFKRFIDLMEPIIDRNKMGPILIQLPPSFEFKSIDKLEEFLKIIPNDIRFTVEFRNKSWLKNRTWRLLETYNVAYTIVDEPLLPRKPVITTDFTFIRWHGKNEKLWYDYQYSKKELKPWTREIQDISSQVKQIYGYFNNHFKGFAIRNLLEMNEMLGRLTEKQASIKNNVEGFLDGKLGQGTLFP